MHANTHQCSRASIVTYWLGGRLQKARYCTIDEVFNLKEFNLNAFIIVLDRK